MTYSKQMQSEFFADPDAHLNPLDTKTSGARASSYLAVLQEPTASLVGGSSDRLELAAIAILGYN